MASTETPSSSDDVAANNALPAKCSSLSAESIAKSRRKKKPLPDDVLKEIAKADLARSNQWLVGAFIVSIPAIVMVITFTNFALSNPRMEFVFWTGASMGIFVPLGSFFMSYYVKNRAIKTLCQIHEREMATRSSSNGNP